MIENLGSIHPRLASDRNELSPEMVDLTGSDLFLQVNFGIKGRSDFFIYIYKDSRENN
jgi:hypothetical protein